MAPSVTMTSPKLYIYDRGVRYDIEVLVGGDVYRHFSYTSIEEVAAEAEKHVAKILDGFANIEAWEAAHGMAEVG